MEVKKTGCTMMQTPSHHSTPHAMYLVDPVISNDERIIRLLKPARAREEGREVIKSADRVNRTLEVVFESTLAFNDLHPRDRHA